MKKIINLIKRLLSKGSVIQKRLDLEELEKEIKVGVVKVKKEVKEEVEEVKNEIKKVKEKVTKSVSKKTTDKKK